MNNTSNKPGVLRDPWQVNKPASVPRVQAPKKEEQYVDMLEGDNVEADAGARKSAVIKIDNYGGIVVDGTESSANAAAQVLKFCVDHVNEVSDIFLDFGVLLVRVDRPGTLSTPFYIQRADGWTLAIPDAATRDQGCLQLIQAILSLKAHPRLSQRMAAYKIKPYRL